MTINQRNNTLQGLAQFTLFISSYSPLFVLIIIRQLFGNWSYLNSGNLDWPGFVLFAKKFGLSTVLLFLLIVGWVGYKITFSNLEKNAPNGDIVWLRNIKNKNSEAIGYIATYIIPFLFQSYESFYEIFAVIFLLYIIYRLYINSTMLLINPILSIKYAIYEVDYEKNGKMCNGFMVSKHKYLEEDTTVKIYEIGHKLFYLTQN